MKELAAKRSTSNQGARPNQASRGPEQQRRQSRQRRRQRQITVKKDETFATIARRENLGEEELIKSTGFDKLVAGQVINLPDKPLGPERAEAVSGGYRPAQPSNQQLRDKSYSVFREQELKSQNDDEIRRKYNRMQPGARGPKADKIRKDYEALTRKPYTGEKGFDLTDTRPGEMYTAEQWELRKSRLEGTPANPLDKAKWWLAGGDRQFDPVTGEFKDTPYEGESLLDVEERERKDREALKVIAMDEYYSKMLSTLEPEQVEQVKSQIKPQTGEPLATEDYPIYEGAETYSDGEFVYYAKDGRVIPVEEFQDYLQENRKHYDNLEDYLNSPEGQKHVFIEGTKKTMESFMWGMNLDDRSMFPEFVTQTQLSFYDPNRDWDDYMRNVLDYRWDAESQAWIKQDDDGSVPLFGSGGGGGYGGGYASGGDWKPGSGQQGRRHGGSADRADKRFAQQVRGLAPTHWRL